MVVVLVMACVCVYMLKAFQSPRLYICAVTPTRESECVDVCAHVCACALWLIISPHMSDLKTCTHKHVRNTCMFSFYTSLIRAGAFSAHSLQLDRNEAAPSLHLASSFTASILTLVNCSHSLSAFTRSTTGGSRRSRSDRATRQTQR